jgi:hypothetical protein
MSGDGYDTFGSELCVVCETPVSLREVHFGHDRGCGFAAGWAPWCDCYRPAHPDCCDCPPDTGAGVA